MSFLHRKNGANKTYADLPPEALFANVLGVLIVAFGLVVLKILSNQEWQRPDSRPPDLTYTVRIYITDQVIYLKHNHHPCLLSPTAVASRRQ